LTQPKPYPVITKISAPMNTAVEPGSAEVTVDQSIVGATSAM
jgi:hypothetical protein